MLGSKRIDFIVAGTTHKVWARVIDLGGRDVEIEFTASGIWRTRFEFAWPIHEIPDEARCKITYQGTLYEVQSILRPTGARAHERKIFVIARRT